MTGKFVICSRCHGTGEALFNHMNGDTYCYLCQAEGIVYRATAAEKAREAEQDAFVNDAHYRLVGGSGSFRNEIRPGVRDATRKLAWVHPTRREGWSEDEVAAYEAERDAEYGRERKLERQLTAWIDLDGIMGETAQSWGEERRARKAAALAAAKADPKMRAKLEKAWETYIAAAPSEFEARIRTNLRDRRLPAAVA